MGKPTVRAATVPAPVGGWNARDALTAMKNTDAVILENMIPGPAGVALRGGSRTYASNIGSPIVSLMTFASPSQAPKLFAATAVSIFDVTAAGPVTGLSVAGLHSGAWQGVMFGTPGGSYLIAANGADVPLRFDGAAWAQMKWQALASYGYALTPSKLMAPCVFGSRIWAIEANSLRVWFKPINQVDTAPTSGSTDPSVYDQCLDFASQCRLGGALVAMGVWTRDGGVGSDDYAVFLTSAGEVLLYAGTDPTNTETWSRVGVFRVAPPIGRRPLVQSGADLGILTQTGLLPLSTVLPLAESQNETAAITDKISGAFQKAYQGNPQGVGWAVQQYPLGALLLVNVPGADGTADQFVMSTLTNGWCRFKGLPATCWGLIGDALYFGTADGRVCRYDVLSDDNGAAISATVLPAFSAFKTAGKKRFMLARPLSYSALGYRAPIKVKLDYDAARETLAQPAVPASSTPWGALWGAFWGPIIKPSSQWQGVRGVGLTASVLVSIASVNPYRLDHIDLTFEAGGIL